MQDKTLTFTMKADASDVVKATDDINKGFDKSNEKIEDANKGLKKTSKSGKGLKSVFSGLTKVTKAFGLALKATGIGIVIGLVAGLTDAFSRNKKLMDEVSITMMTISNVFSQVVDGLVSAYNSVSQANGGFDATKRVVSNLLTVGLTPLKLSFYGIKLAIQELRLAWEKSPFGDGDTATIDELNSSIEETKNNIQKTAVEAIKAGVNITKDLGEAIGEIGQLGDAVVDNMGDVSVKAANESAKAQKSAIDGAITAAAQAGKIAAQYERQAEKLRQIRDDERLSIEDRKKANDELAGVLDKQEEKLIAQADAVIAGAKAELEKNNTIENQAALVDALAAKEQVLADIEGKRSEQKANDLALAKEAWELENSRFESESERQLARLEWEASRASIEEERLAKLQEALNLENQLLDEKLARDKERYAEGTQARQDAEQYYLDNKQELDQKQEELDKDVVDNDVKNNTDGASAKIKIAQGVLDASSKLAEEGSALSKGIAIGQAVAQGALGIQQAWTGPASVPKPFDVPLRVAETALIAATTAKTISSLGGSGSGANPSGVGNAGGVGVGAPAPPSFNLIEGTQESGIIDSLNQNNNQPVKAYVVSGDVTTAQSLDRNIVEESSF